MRQNHFPFGTFRRISFAIRMCIWVGLLSALFWSRWNLILKSGENKSTLCRHKENTKFNEWQKRNRPPNEFRFPIFYFSSLHRYQHDGGAAFYTYPHRYRTIFTAENVCANCYLNTFRTVYSADVFMCTHFALSLTCWLHGTGSVQCVACSLERRVHRLKKINLIFANQI